MRPHPFLTAALVAALPAYPGVAEGQISACAERARIVDYLAARFAERPVARGLATRGGVVELLATNDGKTWTLIVTAPDGTACLIAAGEGWETVRKTEGEAT